MRRLSTLPSTCATGLAQQVRRPREHGALASGRPGRSAPRRRRWRRSRRRRATRAPAGRRGRPSRSPGESARAVSRSAAGWMMPRCALLLGTREPRTGSRSPPRPGPARSSSRRADETRRSDAPVHRVGGPPRVAVDEQRPQAGRRGRAPARTGARSCSCPRRPAGSRNITIARRAVAQRDVERDAQRRHLAHDVLARSAGAPSSGRLAPAARPALGWLARRRGQRVPTGRAARLRSGLGLLECVEDAGHGEGSLRGWTSAAPPAAFGQRGEHGQARGTPRPGRRCGR